MTEPGLRPLDPPLTGVDGVNSEETIALLKIMLVETELTLCTIISRAEELGVAGISSRLKVLAERLRESVPPLAG
jgi:ABC-type molybdenum transport system ATPase subunit/photorepair protein PhrA